MIQNKEAHRRMLAARTTMVLDQQFWGALSSRLRLVEDPSCKTAWTDGTRIGYNPDFVLRLTSRHGIALMAHETEHCARGHSWRRSGREPRLWNVACDLSINSDLRDCKFELPAGALFPEQYGLPRGKSAEWYYDRLMEQEQQKRQEQEQQQKQQRQGDGVGSSETGGEDESEDEDEEGQTDASGTGDEESDEEDEQDEAGESSGEDESDEDGEQGGEGEPSTVDEGSEQGGPEFESDLGEVRDAPSTTVDEGDGSEGPDATEEDWRQAVIQAAAIAQGQGKLPAGLERLVKDARAPLVDWRPIMRRFAQECASADYSWRRPNRRYRSIGMYMPELYSQEVGVIAIGVDTSGSIDNVLLAQFEAEIQAIADEVQPREIHVFYADAQVHRVDVFQRYEPVKLHPCGGGGTDFRPVFQAIEKMDEPPVCAIYLTDLYGTFPEQDPGVPTLWVTGQKSSIVPPFGEVLAAA